MGLNEYHRKRDFKVTAEPRGEEHASGDVLSFIIQKHAASHLHYDFRLELDGVLKSWAVPKGPSLDPEVKRLAVHVEDHPIEYGDFEGVIPKGEYGGGTVMLWDRGTWVPDGDPRAAYRKGSLKFRLEGEKVRGSWRLVRSRRGEEGQKEQWLLFKDADDEARPGSDGALTEEAAWSVKTGRTMEEIAEDADATWRSNRGGHPGGLEITGKPRMRKKPGAASKSSKASKPAADAEGAPKRRAKTGAKASASPVAAIPGAKKGALPKTPLPELATLVDEVPPGDDWIHEIKFDGYRILAIKDRKGVRLLTRKGNDWTDKFPTMAARLAELPADSAVLDGELVVMTPEGTTSFQLLQNVLGSGREEDLVFYAFDLIHLDGFDLKGATLMDRKEALRGLLAGSPADGAVRFSDHIVGRGDAFFRQACGMALEGIISKRASSRYTGKRTKDWLKVKCILRQEFVIGGYTDPKGSRVGFGALLLGVYEGDELRFAGKVGTGFNEESLRQLLSRMKTLHRDTPPFTPATRARKEKGAHWLEPKLVCEVAFTEWTADDLLRHPTFQGLREDKKPREVVRENAKALPSPAPSVKSDDSDGGASSSADSKVSTRGRTGSPPPSTRTRRSRRGVDDAEVAGVRISSPDKVIYPALGITKLEMARFYEAIGKAMLPHVGDRPLTLVRCPDGVGGQCFYQKHGDEHFIDAIGRVNITENDGDVKVYTYVDSVPALVGMVQMGVIELHTSNAKIDDFEKPDRFIMDLDPAPDVPWARVVASAFTFRDRLAELGLKSWVKTTGGKGLHVVVPVARKHTWDEVKEFSRALAIDVAGAHPGEYITKSTLAARKGKIFIDYLRNGRGATAISAYCARAKPTAAVSVPIEWDELSPKLKSDDFTPARVIERVQSLTADPWAGFFKTRQTLTKKAKAALGID